MISQDNLALSLAITKKTEEVCIGLEEGVADIYEMVTERTAHLLKYWFLRDFASQRNKLNFHLGQKQAILNTIYAHEVLHQPSLETLYKKISPESLENKSFLSLVSQPKHMHPKYCIKMATGTGKTWVLQALMIWQILNKTEYPNDRRFTKNFLLVAPGLIIYDRLLDALKGRADERGIRDFEKSDIKIYAELFVPKKFQELIFHFVSNNVSEKNEIGKKITSNGLIAVTNWNLLIEETEIKNLTIDSTEPSDIVKTQLPILPSLSNNLGNLDNRTNENNALNYLKSLPDLLNFNDEAHHIHSIRKNGETTEVEWQKSLTTIALLKKDQFIQIDFSATPYNQLGSRNNAKKIFFPHIISDFDLASAINQCLVKSIALDMRETSSELEELSFVAEKDDRGAFVLSDGQKKMLRAGLTKLDKLEEDFKKLDSTNKPKMLVVCEDTKVTMLVKDFFTSEGLDREDTLCIDSSIKSDLNEKEWQEIKWKLSGIDQRTKPRIIVSVLMLREGFDVNNICVIVPLRSSQANILLEQIVGRGLRLMWRKNSIYEEMRKNNRILLDEGKAPNSLIDILSIIEHPRYRDWYKQNFGFRIGEIGNLSQSNSCGDLENIGLVNNYEAYDFEFPIILRDADESIEQQHIDPKKLQPFTSINIDELKLIVGKGDTWNSSELQSDTIFGSYKVNGSIFNVDSYNDYLARITHRIGAALSNPMERRFKNIIRPFIGSFYKVKLAHIIDIFIRNYLFESKFDPLKNENWRILLTRDVLNHIVRVIALAFSESLDKPLKLDAEIEIKKLSETINIVVNLSYSIETKKSIYPRLPYPQKNGGLEKQFIECCNKDSTVQAFCKLCENRHNFLNLHYMGEDGLLRSYFPDFIVRCRQNIYIVETKSNEFFSTANVIKKEKAASLYCARINAIPFEQRKGNTWHYVLLNENRFEEHIRGNGTLSNLLDISRNRNFIQNIQQKLEI